MTTSTSWRGMPSRHWSPSICSIFAVAALSTAAIFTGRTCRNSNPPILSSLHGYLDAACLPRAIHVPMDFEDQRDSRGHPQRRAVHLDPPRSRVEILMPQRGTKHAFLELVEKNARHSFRQRSAS